MLFLQIAAFALSACSASASVVSFVQWKTTHAKRYDSEHEHRLRYAIWSENLRYIEEFNAKGDASYWLKMNEHGDLTPAEFQQRLGSFPPHGTGEHGSDYIPGDGPFPSSVDWRTKGAVSSVKNQGSCGSCWAFSSLGAVEGAWALYGNSTQVFSLSEQQLVDCSTENLGCQGGLFDFAFEYVVSNGVTTEKAYPYKARATSCHYNRKDAVATISSYRDIEQGNEQALTAALAEHGPIAIAIDASHLSFQFYGGGIYSPWLCSSTNLDHGVLAVGYGTDDKSGKDYYIVKNSWGTTWGMDGYLYMVRNNKNKCGVASCASFPVVGKQ